MTMASVGVSAPQITGSKFVVGDTVRCKVVNNQHKPDRFTQGAGWRKNRVFTVSSITMADDGRYVYWGHPGDNGVYEGYLEKEY